MNMKNEIIEKPIYNICTVIHRLSKLNLEFIGNNLDTSFKLINAKTPSIMENSKIKTSAYIHNFSKKNHLMKLFIIQIILN